jgi:hypothetical protein
MPKKTSVPYVDPRLTFLNQVYVVAQLIITSLLILGCFAMWSKLPVIQELVSIQFNNRLGKTGGDAVLVFFWSMHTMFMVFSLSTGLANGVVTLFAPNALRPAAYFRAAIFLTVALVLMYVYYFAWFSNQNFLIFAAILNMAVVWMWVSKGWPRKDPLDIRKHIRR